MALKKFTNRLKRFSGVKGFVCGLLIGTIGITTVFASAGGIRSAVFNSNIIVFNGEQLELSQPMISVINEGEHDARNFMPVRAVLEAMGYEVDWDGSRNAVIVNSRGAGGSVVRSMPVPITAQFYNFSNHGFSIVPSLSDYTSLSHEHVRVWDNRTGNNIHSITNMAVSFYEFRHLYNADSVFNEYISKLLAVGFVVSPDSPTGDSFQGIDFAGNVVTVNIIRSEYYIDVIR